MRSWLFTPPDCVPGLIQHLMIHPYNSKKKNNNNKKSDTFKVCIGFVHCKDYISVLNHTDFIQLINMINEINMEKK